MDHPNSHGTRIRCPLLETGANSVMPWVIPKMIACRMVTRVLPVGRRGESILRRVRFRARVMEMV